MAELTSTPAPSGLPLWVKSVPMGSALPIARLRDLLALTKPSITFMAVVVAAGALALAPGHISFARALVSLLAIGMAVAGAGALNMWLERDVDVLMTRTRDRPLAAGRISARMGLGLGIALAFASLPVLLAVGGALPTALTALSLFLYVLVYTPMKRTSPWSLVVGAVPGAMPALMGSTVVSGRFDRVGVLLFAIMFLWQLPHFLAIAIYRESEYAAAGHRVAPARWGLRISKVLVLVTGVALAIAGTLVWPLGVSGVGVGIAAAALGAWFVAVCARGMRTQPRASDDAWARRVFRASLVYQLALFGALAADLVVAKLVH